MRPVISILIQTPEPGEWYFSARLGDAVVGHSQGDPLPTAAAAMLAGLEAIKATMTARASVSDSLPISDSLPAEVERDHE